jgi:hypothetical protein
MMPIGKLPFCKMFSSPSVNSLSPHEKTTAFHFPPHDRDDFLLLHAKLRLDSVEGGAVLPCHTDGSINFFPA